MQKVKNFRELVEQLELKKPHSRVVVFRGQSNARWPILPKVGRPEYARKYDKVKGTMSENSIFTAWVRYAKFYITKEPQNLWDWYAIAQHYGLATRLLDWSKNPLVAAYFACWENPKQDGVIICNSIPDFSKIDLNTNPIDFKDFGFFYPSGLASRIVNQRGLFTISGNPTTPLEKEAQAEGSLERIVIAKSAKSDILESLDLFNVNKLSLFQDLNAMSDYLNDYVKYDKNKSLTELRVKLSTDEIDF
jgi:hypothetical protein